MKVCTIYDAKAEAYLTPLFFQAIGQAVRSFGDAVNQANTEFNRHPEDYTLFLLGEWDEFGGTFTINAAPTPLARGHELVNREQLSLVKGA